ncbi:MAG: efflux RND transporter periplasmic adaptor subunit [Pseudoxanthomonas suwonensis]|nr:efflux RND transporter periplasmic adaptor subunit [Pseudoxanthomonas suwonensis]
MNTPADLLKELRIEREDDPTPGRRRRWIVIAALVAVALAVAALLLGRGDGGTPVETTTAQPLSGAGAPETVSVLDASGYVVARRMATVSSKITGKVEAVYIEEGMRVTEGQVLARLEPVDADAQRALSRSQLGAARSQVEGVRAQLAEAEANAARLQPLLRRQLVSRAQYDQAVAQRDALRAQLQTARRNVQVAGDGLRIAELGVDNTVVRAPFSGVVIAKAAQPGEIVSPLSAGGGFTRTGIGTIVDMDSLEVEVDVGEAYIGRVQAGMPVEATLNAYPDWKIPAEVIAIIPTADRGRATIRVRIALKSDDARIVPDMGVKVGFLERLAPAGETPTGVRVLNEAIVRRDGKDLAFVVDEAGTVQRREVQPGRALGTEREVLAGIATGEVLVVNPSAELADGTRVSITGAP